MGLVTRPPITPRGEEKLYFEALKRHELVFHRCSECATVLFPLRQVCISCSHENLVLEVSAGNGIVHSFTTQHRASHPFFADSVPYTLLLVDMAEGFRVLANLIEGTEADISVGAPVDAVFDDVDDELTLLRFRPTSEKDERP